jgi:hypothetical protein
MASDPNALSEFDQDFLDFEVDRLIGSARVGLISKGSTSLS